MVAMPRDGHELRERILDAALLVMRERGIAGTRTSAIAAAAGCAEGSIYRYFSGKQELLREVVRRALPDLDALLKALPARAGQATLRANLLEAMQAAAPLYRELALLTAGVLADADLLGDQRKPLAADAFGLGRGADALVLYLRREQEQGRLRVGVDPEAAGRVLLDGCFGACFSDMVLGLDDAEQEGSLAELVELVIGGLEPTGESR
jgi:AcrR family transcriptional regulator